MQTNLKPLIALLAGSLLVFAFAPFAIRSIAFIAPALLLWCLLEADKKTAFYRGILFGCGFFATGTYWIYISIHTFGEAPLLVSLIITCLFVLALSLFSGLMAFLFSLFNAPLSWRCLAIFPSLWVLTEWLRSWVFTGFPWLYLGYSQVDTTFKAFAPLIGVYGLSFVIALISGALIVLLQAPRKQKYTAIVLVAALWITAKAFSPYEYVTTQTQPIAVSLIQGNIPQSLKWDAEQAQNTLAIYTSLTNTQASHNLIVWPEAAIPVTKTHALAYLKELNRKLKLKDQILITGIPVDEWPKFYNGVLMLGKANGEYHKIHLVPYGEYYPLKWLVNPLFDYLKIPMSDLTAGAPDQDLLDANGIQIAPFVCYEIAYPQQVLKQVKDAELIITVTDDSWFGDSIAAAQHLEIAQERALETQRYLLFSTNNGVSAVINPQGRLIAQLPLDQQGIIHTQVHATQGETPLMRWGYWPVSVLIVILLLVGLSRRK